MLEKVAWRHRAVTSAMMNSLVWKLPTGTSVTIAQRAGENDQLFGSVTSKDIAEALERVHYTIDRRKIHLEDPIKQLGAYKVPVRLHKDVQAEITVQVVREAE